MLQPQDLPGRFGRVVKAVDHLLKATNCESVVGGGWAVWRHGYVGRVTYDVDIALPANRIEEFLRVASVGGFEILPQPEGRWPKVLHKETGIKVDILPEGARPGTPNNLAPTTIPHPTAMGAIAGTLTYMRLESLIELKLAAGRSQDDADVIKLLQENPDRISETRRHLEQVHEEYVTRLDRLTEQADEESEDP